MVFNATFNNVSVILWRSVLLVEETGENHWPVASHWQILSHNVVSSTNRHEHEPNLYLSTRDVTIHWHTNVSHLFSFAIHESIKEIQFFQEIVVSWYILDHDLNIVSTLIRNTFLGGSRHGHDRIIVGFTTTCAISAYHH
jgi:hypothetical protein